MEPLPVFMDVPSDMIDWKNFMWTNCINKVRFWMQLDIKQLCSCKLFWVQNILKLKYQKVAVQFILLRIILYYTIYIEYSYWLIILIKYVC